MAVSAPAMTWIGPTVRQRMPMCSSRRPLRPAEPNTRRTSRLAGRCPRAARRSSSGSISPVTAA